MLSLSRFAYLCGIYNFLIGLGLIFPAIREGVFALNFCGETEAQLAAVLLFYTTAVLVYTSRDLKKRASLLYYQAIIRFLAAVVLIPAGIYGNSGVMISVFGVVDALIGVIFMIGLTQSLGFTHKKLASLDY